MPSLSAESCVHIRNPSEIMQVTGGRFRMTSSNLGWSFSVASTKLMKEDIDGSLSVTSTPGGTPTMLSGKGISMMEMESFLTVARMVE